MPPMLREPWFLRGRKSVLLRAVLMSFVLSALSMLAGLTFRLVLFASFDAELFRGLTFEAGRIIWGTLFGGIVMSAIGIPCSVWYGHSYLRTTAAWLLVVVTCSQSFQFVASLTGWMERAGFETQYISMDYVALFLLLWFAWSIAYLRRSRSFAGCALLSAVVLPVIVLVMPATGKAFSTTPWDVLSSWSGGVLPRLEFGESSAVKATGTLLAILFVPWGIPFWFPPAAQPAETAG